MFSRKDKRVTRARRKAHIRKVVRGTPERPRLAVFRSLKHTYVQIIDDVAGRTLLSASTLDRDVKEALKAEGIKGTSNAKAARVVGRIIAEKAKARSIEKVCFDRGGNLYFGCVKQLADSAREAGLKF